MYLVKGDKVNILDEKSSLDGTELVFSLITKEKKKNQHVDQS